MELIDQANALVELNTEQAIKAIRSKNTGESATHCESCGDEIPQARRVAVRGCQTCAGCQSIIELRDKQRRG